MRSDSVPNSWSDPDYVTTIVGVLAAGAICLYSTTTDSLSTETTLFVLLAVFLPMTLAGEIARRW